jgi:hypothetical protein
MAEFYRGVTNISSSNGRSFDKTNAIFFLKDGIFLTVSYEDKFSPGDDEKK